MLRIYDELEWRRRRRMILLTVFTTGSLFGAMMMNTAPAGSNDLGVRPMQARLAADDCGGSRSGLKLACKLESTPN